MASVSKRRWTHKGTKKEAWVLRYKDEQGRHRSRQFERKKDADAYRNKVVAELDAGLHAADGTAVTVAKLADAYLEAAEARREAGRRMSTSHLRTLKLFFGKHIVPHLGARRLSELSYSNVDAWARNLSAGGLSASSVKRAMHLFKVAVDFAMRRGWLHRNVVAEAMKEYRGGGREPIRTFSEQEARRLLAVAAVRPPNFTARQIDMLRCFVYLGAFCGLRYGEIAGLKVEHVDFDCGLIEVRHSLTVDGELKCPKTRAGVRDVPMPPVVADELRRWLRSYYMENDLGLVFRRRGGGAISVQNFHLNMWRKLLDRAELGPDDRGRRFHFHALRHFCASMMVQHLVPLTDIASLLGHNSFDVTLQVYAHTIAGGRRRMDVLEQVSANLLAPPSGGEIAQELRIAA
jgi:integrase